jgi:hypothetical protein
MIVTMASFPPQPGLHAGGRRAEGNAVRAARAPHLQIHLEGKMIEALASALKRSPVPVVIDHMARIDASAAWSRSRSRTSCA